ncbi:ABC transporter permease [Deinococcus psychrotolerans]|nr:ABC-2 family transporter protein [Deinococcus psychrotolerans]
MNSSSAHHIWRKFKVLMAVQFAHMTVYRAEIVIWMLSGTLSLIMGLIWMQQASSSPKGEIGGYTAQDFASYFIATWGTAQILVVWVAWELSFDVRQGTLSPKLLRPIDPFWMHYVGHWAERIVRLPLMFVLLVIFALLTGAHYTTDVSHWLAYLMLVPLAFTLRFLLEYSIGLLAFWFEAAENFQELIWVLYAALGGLLAPISLYPAAVQTIAYATPFPYMLSLPCNLLTGKADLGDALRGWLILLGWTLTFAALRAVLWRRGVRKYGAVGA